MGLAYITATLASLILEETKERIFDYGLELAEALELPVTTWREGDPTRSQFWLEAYTLEKLEGIVAGFARSGFLDLAEDEWLDATADQTFGVTVPGATRATAVVVLTNNGAGEYPIGPGELVLKNSTTDALYQNTSGGTLDPGPGTTLSISVEAYNEGSDSSAAANEIDELVTSLLGVGVTSSTTAVGVDKQTPQVTRQQCRDKLGSLSPDGPAAAYAYVARNSELTGTRNVTRVRVFPDSDTGDVLIYLAGPSGAVTEPDRALVELAIVTYATPLTITPTVLSATNVVVPVTYQLWVYQSVNKTATEIRADVSAALTAMLTAREIGGDIITPPTGYLYKSLVESTIRSVYAEDKDRVGLVFRVSASLPAGDVSLANNEVATLGTVTGTITFVQDPQ